MADMEAGRWREKGTHQNRSSENSIEEKNCWTGRYLTRYSRRKYLWRGGGWSFT